jgi:hypothetical protein
MEMWKIWEIMGRIEARGARRIGAILILLSFRQGISWKAELGSNKVSRRN